MLETDLSDIELLQAHLSLSENKDKVKKIKSRANSHGALSVLSEAKASQENSKLQTPLVTADSEEIKGGSRQNNNLPLELNYRDELD